MNQAIFVEEMRCVYCKTIIESGENCFLLDLPVERIACSRKCGNLYEQAYYLGTLTK
jgi:hypothetical protein